MTVSAVNALWIGVGRLLRIGRKVQSDTCRHLQVRTVEFTRERA